MKSSFAQIVFASILFVACLVGYFFWYNSLQAASDAAAALATQIATKNASVSQAETAAEELSRLSSVQDEFGSYFVAPDSIVGFLENLQSLGTDLKTNVSVVSVSANSTPRPHLDLALSIEGPFDAVLKTVGAIEFSPHDITVKTLTLTSADNGWTAALNLTVGTASSTPSYAPSSSVATTSVATTTTITTASTTATTTP